MLAERPIALVTGASRRIGIGSAIARRLACEGWDVATTYWTSYDARMPWGRDADEGEGLHRDLRSAGARSVSIEADLSKTDSPAAVFDFVEYQLGPVSALIIAHCESVDSSILDTTVDAFDLHFAVNARATWLLIREFALRSRVPHGRGRIIGLTSDHTAGNLPYGASKAALDRIVLASARELAHLGITANVVNPGATDTGWMTPELLSQVADSTPLGRVGQPEDCANLGGFPLLGGRWLGQWSADLQQWRPAVVEGRHLRQSAPHGKSSPHARCPSGQRVTLARDRPQSANGRQLESGGHPLRGEVVGRGAIEQVPARRRQHRRPRSGDSGGHSPPAELGLGPYAGLRPV